MIKQYIQISDHANELNAVVRPGLPPGKGNIGPQVEIALGQSNSKRGSSLFQIDWEEFRDDIDAEFARIKESEQDG